MTKQEAIAALDALKKGDNEGAHLRADEILCDYLRASGAEDLADAFDRAAGRVKFWYS